VGVRIFMLGDFTVSDFLVAVSASCIFPLLLVAPGYACGWITNIQKFRQRRLVTQLLLSTAISACVVPASSFLVARIFSFQTQWYLYGSAWIACITIALSGLKRPPFAISHEKFAALPATTFMILWVVVATAVLVDLQLGHHLYTSYPSVSDHSARSPIVNALADGVFPPNTPFFAPCHPRLLRYHYFWYLLCANIQAGTGYRFDAFPVIIGSAVWSGVLIFSLLVLSLRFLLPERFRQVGFYHTAILLVLVGGLDVLVVPANYTHGLFYAKLSFWPSPKWIDQFLWVPHHAAAAAASFSSFLFIRLAMAKQTPTQKDRLTSVVIAGFGLASGLGLSVWITLTVAPCLVAWAVVSLAKKWYKEFSTILAAAGIAIVLSIPYVRDLLAASPASEFRIVAPTVKLFEPIYKLVCPYANFENMYIKAIISFALLPLTYAIELGFFCVAPVIYLRHRIRSSQRLTRDEWFYLTVFVVSITVVTFVRSNLGNNDLGWRAIMLYQFVLILWSVVPTHALLQQVSRDMSKSMYSGTIHFTRRERNLCLGLLAVGLLNTAYAVFDTRMRTIIYPAGDPALVYDVRAAYQWINRNLPRTVTLQHKPRRRFYDGLYGRRQVVAAPMSFGGSLDEYRAAEKEIDPLFGYVTSFDAVETVAQRYCIDLLFVTPEARVWRNKMSWVWTETPIYENAHVRVFATRRFEQAYSHTLH